MCPVEDIPKVRLYRVFLHDDPRRHTVAHYKTTTPLLTYSKNLNCTNRINIGYLFDFLMKKCNNFAFKTLLRCKLILQIGHLRLLKNANTTIKGLFFS